MDTITIDKDSNAQAGDLQVTVTQPSTTTVYQGSVNALQTRIAGYADQITAIQAQQTADEALLAQIEAQFATESISLS